MLDLIERGLAQSGISCQRLDGSMSLPQRRRALEVFRCSPDCQVLLATLGAAGVGYATPNKQVLHHQAKFTDNNL